MPKLSSEYACTMLVPSIDHDRDPRPALTTTDVHTRHQPHLAHSLHVLVLALELFEVSAQLRLFVHDTVSMPRTGGQHTTATGRSRGGGWAAQRSNEACSWAGLSVVLPAQPVPVVCPVKMEADLLCAFLQPANRHFVSVTRDGRIKLWDVVRVTGALPWLESPVSRAGTVQDTVCNEGLRAVAPPA